MCKEEREKKPAYKIVNLPIVFLSNTAYHFNGF